MRENATDRHKHTHKHIHIHIHRHIQSPKHTHIHTDRHTTDGTAQQNDGENATRRTGGGGGRAQQREGQQQRQHTHGCTLHWGRCVSCAARREMRPFRVAAAPAVVTSRHSTRPQPDPTLLCESLTHGLCLCCLYPCYLSVYLSIYLSVCLFLRSSLSVCLLCRLVDGAFSQMHFSLANSPHLSPCL